MNWRGFSPPRFRTRNLIVPTGTARPLGTPGLKDVALGPMYPVSPLFQGTAPFLKEVELGLFPLACWFPIRWWLNFGLPVSS